MCIYIILLAIFTDCTTSVQKFQEELQYFICHFGVISVGLKSGVFIHILSRGLLQIQPPLNSKLIYIHI